MQKKTIGLAVLVILAQLALPSAMRQAQAQAKTAAYPTMAPLDQYLIADKAAEIALAKAAGPASIADHADIMVLTAQGYKTEVKGDNGFVCMVERSWAKPTDDAEFWNPKMRAPNCFNAAAVKSVVPVTLLKTKLVLEGKSPQEIAQAIETGFADKSLPALAPDAMAYMMSKQQYLDDKGKNWHPHVMFYYSGNATGQWGANNDDSPVMAAEIPQQHFTILFDVVRHWSDGTPDSH